MKSYLYIGILFLIITSCKKQDATTTETNYRGGSNTIVLSNEQFTNAKMQLVKPNTEAIINKVEVNGLIDVPPNNRAVVSAIAGGYIKNFNLIVGTPLRKGDLLFTIENMEFVELQKDFLETSERLDYLKMEYERQHALFKEQINSEKNFLNAKSNYQSALATHNGLKKQLEMLNLDPSSKNIQSVAPLIAPISGKVAQIFVETGNYAGPQDKLLEIVNDDHQHVELQVFGKEALKLEIGQKVEFSVPSMSEELFTGKIYLIGNTLDENRTIKVHVHIDESVKQKFVVGMFVKATIFTKEEMYLVLPEDCIIKNESQHVLLKLKEMDSEFHFEKIYLKDPVIENGKLIIKDSSEINSNYQFLQGGNILMVGEE